MTTDSIQVTAEEIVQFRAELADNSRAIAALDAIEECEGYLEDAVPAGFCIWQDQWSHYNGEN